MHSSRMRTARGSSHPRGGGCLPQCILGYTHPLGVGLETPRCGPGDPPPGVGLETSPDQTPQLPPWVWAWRPPLETCCKACWDTTYNACWDTNPPMNRMTDAKILPCPKLCLWVVKIRLHSNRMCTAHLLPVSPSMHCTCGGACFPPVNGILDTLF